MSDAEKDKEVMNSEVGVTSVSKYQVVIFFYYIFITLSGVIASALAEVSLK